jgi:hypothetical protein
MKLKAKPDVSGEAKGEDGLSDYERLKGCQAMAEMILMESTKFMHRGTIVTKKYKSGTFCIDIACPRHKELESLEGDAYLEKKKFHCRECFAWQFLIWLEQHDYRVIQTLPEISAKELSARLKGIDPVRVEDLTIDEILTL